MFKDIFSVFFTFFRCIYYFALKKLKYFFQSYVRAYCFTNGWISKFLSQIISLSNKRKNKYYSIQSEYFEKNLDYNKIQRTLKTNGYYVFENQLNKNY